MAKALPVWQKSYEGIQKAESMTPTADDLALINHYALEPVTADDVLIVPMKACNDQYDRADERFPKAYLERFEATLPGKSLMLGHDYSTEPAGRIFDTQVRKDALGHYLHVRAYMDAADPATGKVRKGIHKGVSIGFQPDLRNCDLCGKDYDGWYKQASDDEPCDHIRGRLYNGRKCTLTYGGDLQKVEGLEMSLVWLGCQFNAETTRTGGAGTVTKAEHFDALAPAGDKGESMDPKEIAALEGRAEAAEEQVATLTPLAQDGEKYRTWQKAEIARLYTSLGEEKAGAAMVAALKDATADMLDSVRTEIDTRHAKVFAASGGQVGGAEDRESDSKRRTAHEILFGAAARRGGA